MSPSLAKTPASPPSADLTIISRPSKYCAMARVELPQHRDWQHLKAGCSIQYPLHIMWAGALHPASARCPCADASELKSLDYPGAQSSQKSEKSNTSASGIYLKCFKSSLQTCWNLAIQYQALKVWDVLVVPGGEDEDPEVSRQSGDFPEADSEGVHVVIGGVSRWFGLITYLGLEAVREQTRQDGRRLQRPLESMTCHYCPGRVLATAI